MKFEPVVIIVVYSRKHEKYAVRMDHGLIGCLVLIHVTTAIQYLTRKYALVLQVVVVVNHNRRHAVSLEIGQSGVVSIVTL